MKDKIDRIHEEFSSKFKRLESKQKEIILCAHETIKNKSLDEIRAKIKDL